MRITILNQFYVPTLAATASLTRSLAVHLAERGHEVTVVASRGAYVAGETNDIDGASSRLRVHRLWSPGFGKSRLLGRLVDYAMFYLLATWRMVRIGPQDVVVSLTTPPYIVLAAFAHRWRSRATRVVLWNMDCYPEAPESVGMLKAGGITSRCLRAINRLVFRRLDAIVCLDTAMANLLQQNYGQGRTLPISVIPNWEPLSLFPGPRHDSRPRRDRAGRIVVLYQGNAGVGHEFETVEGCARLLRDAPVTFRFVGGGKWWGWLLARQGRGDLPAWEVRPYVPKEATPALLADADVALITLRPSSAGVMSPSKLHSNLAAGLPILYIGPADTNVDECLHRFHCGVSLRNGDDVAAAEFLEGLLASPERWAALSANARAAFEAAYNDTCTLPLFDTLLEELASRTRRCDGGPLGGLEASISSGRLR